MLQKKMEEIYSDFIQTSHQINLLISRYFKYCDSRMTIYNKHYQFLVSYMKRKNPHFNFSHIWSKIRTQRVFMYWKTLVDKRFHSKQQINHDNLKGAKDTIKRNSFPYFSFENINLVFMKWWWHWKIAWQEFVYFNFLFDCD